MLLVERHQSLWFLTLRGEHDLGNSETLDRQIESIVAHGQRVVVDLSEAAFIDSTVINALVRGYKRAREAHDGVFVLVCPPAAAFPRRVLELSGISGAIPLYDSRAAAVAALA